MIPDSSSGSRSGPASGTSRSRAPTVMGATVSLQGVCASHCATWIHSAVDRISPRTPSARCDLWRPTRSPRWRSRCLPRRRSSARAILCACSSRDVTSSRAIRSSATSPRTTFPAPEAAQPFTGHPSTDPHSRSLSSRAPRALAHERRPAGFRQPICRSERQAGGTSRMTITFIDSLLASCVTTCQGERLAVGRGPRRECRRRATHRSAPWSRGIRGDVLFVWRARR